MSAKKKKSKKRLPSTASKPLGMNKEQFLKDLKRGLESETPPAPVDKDLKDLEEFFRSQAGRPDDMDQPPIGFSYRGPDMRLSDTVARMLLGVTDPKKKVVKIATIVKYDDGTISTLFELSGGRGPVPILDISSRMAGNIPAFESMDPSLWPTSVDYDEIHTIVVRRHIKAAPTDELAVQVRKMRRSSLVQELQFPTTTLK